MRQYRRIESLAVAACVSLVLGSCGGHESGAEDDADEVREILISAAPHETHEGAALSHAGPTQHEVLAELGVAARTKSTRGVFLRLGPMSGAWGRAGDLVEALATLRKAKKPVHCHFDAADNVSYLLMATSCDRITMNPSGMLNLVGPSLHLFYARTLLETIGVKAEMFHIGRYKGAADVYTEDDIPAASREALTALVDGLHRTLADAVSARVGSASASQLIDNGPYVAAQAREAKLVDDLQYDDGARAEARRVAAKASGLAEAKVRVRRIHPGGRPEKLELGDLLRALSGDRSKSVEQGERIVVAHLDGSIVDADESRGLGGSNARSGPFVTTIRNLADDVRVRAVVLRINSPGGSALASDRMWHAVRRLAGRKPVIVSIGDMAASGGYYVASAGTEIFAHPQSLVGSIGVVGGKLDLSNVGERIGVRPVVLQSGRHASWLSPVRPFDESERAVFRAMLQSTYDRFIERVAEGRKMTREQVLKAAEGRVMTATEGKSLGLIDTVGGLGAALERARRLAGAKDDITVVEWPRRHSVVEALGEALGTAPSDAHAQWGPLLRLDGARDVLSYATSVVEVLSGGESSALVPPFGFVVR